MSWRLILISTLGGVFVILALLAAFVFIRGRREAATNAASTATTFQTSTTSTQVVDRPPGATNGASGASTQVMAGDGGPVATLDADGNPTVPGPARPITTTPGGSSTLPLNPSDATGSRPGPADHGADMASSGAVGAGLQRPATRGGLQDTDPSDSRVRGPGPVEDGPAPAGTAGGGPGRPSFNCRNARTWSEQAVCGNRILSQADVVISQAYNRLRGQVDDTGPLVASQQAFLRDREGCRQAPQPIPCLAQVHALRLQELGQWQY